MCYHLSPDRKSITRSEVLEAYNPIFEIPTTGVLIGDSFFFAANPQFDRRREDGSMPPPGELQDIHVVQLKLRQSRSGDKQTEIRNASCCN
jgi:hypothetical protein